MLTSATGNAIPGSVYALSGLPGPNSPHGPGSHNQEREKNVATPAILHRALDLFDCELEIVRKEIEHPERFIDKTVSVPLANWGGTLAQLLELIIALFLTGLIRKSDGRKMNLAEVANLFERLFGLKISDLYGRKTRLLTRKKNESPFLDSLLFLYRKAVEKMGL